MNELKIPFKGHYHKESAQERLDWIQKITNHNFISLKPQHVSSEALQGKIENFIGTVEIPLGIAGPIAIKGKYANGNFIIPIATTQGTLVAGISRGAKAINLAGEVNVMAIAQKMRRSPVFEFESLLQAITFQQWLPQQITFFNELIEDSSTHTKLIDIEVNPIGKLVYTNFVFQTADAAGHNMSAVCVWKICQWLSENVHKILDLELKDFFIESTLSASKKITFQQTSCHNGIHVIAEILLPNEVIEEIFHVSAKQFFKAYQLLKTASSVNGNVGFSTNLVNFFAGIFTATGQDIASISESAIGQFELYEEENGIYCSMSLPSLVIGTIGGGTSLLNQQDCLKMIACDGKDHVFKLAEIICSGSLALELSSLGAIASNELVVAQEKIGRSRQKLGLRKHQLDISFFDGILGQANQRVKLLNVLELDIPIENTVLSDLSTDKCVGLFGFELQYEYQQEENAFNMVVKIKATSDEVTRMLSKMAQACGKEVGYYFDFLREELQYSKSEIREIKIYELLKQRRFSKIPNVYGFEIDNHKETYWLGLEDISNYSNYNTVSKKQEWTDKEIKQVLQDMAQFHALFYNHTKNLENFDFLHKRNSEQSVKLLPLIQALLDHHAREFSELYTKERIDLLENISIVYEYIWTILDEQPKTLIHNAFNPTNLAMRSSYETCIYDWETAIIHIPQHDLCEFLLFVLPTENFVEEQQKYVDLYIENLSINTRQALDFNVFWKGYNACHQDIALNRLNLYMMEYTFKGYEFLPRAVENNFTFLEHMLQK